MVHRNADSGNRQIQPFENAGQLPVDIGRSLGYRERMASGFRIGQLAQAANVPVSTLRYYERVGLLEADYRTDGNYRVYGEDALQQVRFIRVAQSAGFHLDDIKSLLAIRTEDGRSCGDVEHLIERRLADLEARLHDLTEARAHLEELQSLCRQTAAKSTCPAIDQLVTASSDG